MVLYLVPATVSQTSRAALVEEKFPTVHGDTSTQQTDHALTERTMALSTHSSVPNILPITTELFRLVYTRYNRRGQIDTASTASRAAHHASNALADGLEAILPS